MNYKEYGKSLMILYKLNNIDEEGNYIYYPDKALIGRRIIKNNNYYFQDISGKYYSFFNDYMLDKIFEFVNFPVSVNDFLKEIDNKKDITLDKLLRKFYNTNKNTILKYNFNANLLLIINSQNEYDHTSKKYLSYLDDININDQLIEDKDEDEKLIEDNKQKIIHNKNNDKNDNNDNNNYLDNINNKIKNIQNKVLFQDRQIKEVFVQVYKSIITYADDDNFIKSNILINGSTGTGKTEIAKQIAQELNIPYVLCDSNSLTPAGYKGNNIEDTLFSLYVNTDFNLNEAEKGMLILDEIDKRIGLNSDNFKDDIVNSLLKVIEGNKFVITKDNNTLEFDTSKLIVIMTGTFTNVKKEKEKSIGFNSNSNTNEILNDNKYGLSDEFYGRISSIVTLNSLSENDLYVILKESNLSAIKKYNNLAQKLDFDIAFNDELLHMLAKEAYKYKSGARGLNKIVAKYFDNLFIDTLDKENNDKEITKSKKLK